MPRKKSRKARPRIRAAWVLVQKKGRHKPEVLTLEEFLGVKSMCRVEGVTRDLQTMVDWHTKHVGLAKKRKISEKELDRITKSLVREPKKDERREKEVEQAVQDLLRGVY